MRAFARGDVSAGEAVEELLRVGARASKAFLKRAKGRLKDGDGIPQYSECKDGVLSEPYEK